MGDPVSIGLIVGGTLLQTSATNKAAEFNRQVAKRDAQVKRLQADKAIQLGEERTNLARGRGREIQAAQRAAAASQNIIVDSGTALALQLDTEQQVEADVQAIRNNARLEAWGYENDAQSSESLRSLISLEAQGSNISTALRGVQAIVPIAREARSTRPSTPRFPTGRRFRPDHDSF